jgi:RES domain-containing protein
LTFDRHELAAIAAWVQKARPRGGVFYRSVSYQYMDPETVLDGKGALLNGGRFASAGTAAVYLAESDAVASNEVTARKARLGGAAQISLDKYPRIVFTVEFALQKVVDLTMKPLTRGMAPIRDKCLAIDDITWSQQLGDLLVKSGVDGLMFPSAIGSGLNLIVYNQCCASDALRLQNKKGLLARLKKIATAAP